MKKAISIILTLVLFGCLLTSVYADDNTGKRVSLSDVLNDMGKNISDYSDIRIVPLESAYSRDSGRVGNAVMLSRYDSTSGVGEQLLVFALNDNGSVASVYPGSQSFFFQYGNGHYTGTIPGGVTVGAGIQYELETNCTETRTYFRPTLAAVKWKNSGATGSMSKIGVKYKATGDQHPYPDCLYANTTSTYGTHTIQKIINNPTANQLYSQYDDPDTAISYDGTGNDPSGCIEVAMIYNGNSYGLKTSCKPDTQG